MREEEAGCVEMVAETERGGRLMEGCCGPGELGKVDEWGLVGKEPCNSSSASGLFGARWLLPETVCLNVNGGLEETRDDLRRFEDETLLLSVPSTSFRETFVPGEAICHGEVGAASAGVGTTIGELGVG